MRTLAVKRQDEDEIPTSDAEASNEGRGPSYDGGDDGQEHYM